MITIASARPTHSGGPDESFCNVAEASTESPLLLQLVGGPDQK